MDAKIASKVIATRIIPVLPKIINSTQTGYVKGRFIGEAARSILDVMDYTKKQNIRGILLFIDFEKAFDSLNWNFMLKCLNAFGFGPGLIRWIETFYSNISSCVLNNGLSTPYFEVQIVRPVKGKIVTNRVKASNLARIFLRLYKTN